jgi:hypothetical protein
MPALSVWSIRAALLYLIAGFTFGAFILTNKGLPISPLVWRLMPIHMEFLLVGWLVQLAMGVAFWILPRFRQQRGNSQAALVAFVLLNVGIWLAAPGSALSAPSWMTLAGRLVEVGAAVAFAVHAWPRVKPAGV